MGGSQKLTSRRGTSSITQAGVPGGAPAMVEGDRGEDGLGRWRRSTQLVAARRTSCGTEQGDDRRWRWPWSTGGGRCRDGRRRRFRARLAPARVPLDSLEHGEARGGLRMGRGGWWREYFSPGSAERWSSPAVRESSGGAGLHPGGSRGRGGSGARKERCPGCSIL